MGMNIKEVLDNRTTEEWVEVLDKSTDEHGLVIYELLDENEKLTKVNKVMGTSVVGLAIALAVSTSVVIANRKKKPGKIRGLRK